MATARTFSAAPAVRNRTHILLGLSGPSGSGKTKSALRVATGMARVFGGKIGVIDTEANRALHYAPGEGETADPKKGTYDFLHIPFAAPFGPLDYLAALDYARQQGCTVIVVDSMSHEHEGPGGVLEMHASESERLAAAWRTSVDAVKMAAWQKPKTERRRLINGLLQMPVSFVFCFRAKEKIRIPGRGETEADGTKAKPKTLGYMPIAGEEFVFEQTANVLLLPGAEGHPEWEPEEMGERSLVKCPEYLQHAFPKDAQLSEETGEALAHWAMGGATQAVPVKPELKPELKLGAKPTPAPAGASKQAAPVKSEPVRGAKFTPAPADVVADIRRCLTGDLEMTVKDAAAWVVKYAGAPLPELSAVQAGAILTLARAAYMSRVANDDDAGFAAAYDQLKKNGVLQ